MALSGCHTKLYKRYSSRESSDKAVRYRSVYRDDILFLVSVAGADAPSMDNAGDYSVWFYTPAEAYASDANLTITIA